MRRSFRADETAFQRVADLYYHDAKTATVRQQEWAEPSDSAPSSPTGKSAPSDIILFRKPLSLPPDIQFRFSLRVVFSLRQPRITTARLFSSSQ